MPTSSESNEKPTTQDEATSTTDSLSFEKRFLEALKTQKAERATKKHSEHHRSVPLFGS